VRDSAISFQNQCDRDVAKSAKEDAKEKQKAKHFLRILRVFLRALRDFAVAFLNFSSANRARLLSL
jgi:hypothetical protein